MICMIFLKKNSILKFLTTIPYLAIYSEPLCATYASFGGGGSITCYHFVYREVSSTCDLKPMASNGHQGVWALRLR